ncbi:MAG: oligosaccharide flippase family protein [Planctomycetes bacterium]|nr:oligosaccharide flippase family protein [Planctomycetota bacterium]
MSQSRTVKAGILASGSFLTTCVRLISAVVLARLLSMYDYATYRQTLLAYAFISPLLMLGLPQALYYFLPGENKRPRTVLVENLLLLSFMAGLFTLFLLFGGNRLLAWRFNNPDIARTLLILAPYPLFMLPASAFGACLITRDRVKQVAVFNVLSRLFMLGTVLTAVLIWRTPAAAIVGTVVGAGIVLLPALKLMFTACNVGSLLPSTKGMWSQLKYAVPLGLAGIIGTISLSLDKMIVSSMCSPEQFAVYVNGAIEIPLIGVLTGSVIAVLVPDFVRMYKADQYQELRALWHRAMVRCLAILLPAMGFILVMAPEIMRVLFSAKYENSAYPFRIYALMLPIRSTSFGAVLMATNHTRTITIGSLLGLIANGVLSVLFVYFIGPIGAAWATVLSVFGLALFYSYIIRGYLQFNGKSMLPWKSIVQLFVAVVLPTLIVITILPVLPKNDILRLTLASFTFLSILFICYHKMNIVKVTDLAQRIYNRFNSP